MPSLMSLRSSAILAVLLVAGCAGNGPPAKYAPWVEKAVKALGNDARLKRYGPNWEATPEAVAYQERHGVDNWYGPQSAGDIPLEGEDPKVKEKRKPFQFVQELWVTHHIAGTGEVEAGYVLFFDRDGEVAWVNPATSGYNWLSKMPPKG